ncbi:hypothetical protein EV426DRAFT_674026 [Tirmania nivea]|nr:hypothetical protein EV426DRAFT_674026 [Tirmania nivea]
MCQKPFYVCASCATMTHGSLEQCGKPNHCSAPFIFAAVLPKGVECTRCALRKAGFPECGPGGGFHRGCWASWWWALNSPGEGLGTSAIVAQGRAEATGPTSAITIDGIIGYSMESGPEGTPSYEVRARHKLLRQRKSVGFNGQRDPYLDTPRRSVRLKAKRGRHPDVTGNTEASSTQALPDTRPAKMKPAAEKSNGTWKKKNLLTSR